MPGSIFHLAFPIHDVEATLRFYDGWAWMYRRAAIEACRDARAGRPSTGWASRAGSARETERASTLVILV